MLAERRREVVPEEAWWKAGTCASSPAAHAGWPRRWRPGGSAGRPSSTGRGGASSPIWPSSPSPSDHPGTVRNSRSSGVWTPAIWPKGRPPRSSRRSTGAGRWLPDELRLPPDVDDSRASQAAVAVCTGLVRQIAEELAVRPEPAGHPGGHRPAGDRRAQPARPGLAGVHRRRSPPAAALRGRRCRLRTRRAAGARSSLPLACSLSPPGGPSYGSDLVGEHWEPPQSGTVRGGWAARRVAGRSGGMVGMGCRRGPDHMAGGASMARAMA